MGAAVTFVIFGASILTYGLYKLVLEPNSLEYMDLLSFILIDVYKRQAPAISIFYSFESPVKILA